MSALCVRGQKYLVSFPDEPGPETAREKPVLFKYCWSLSTSGCTSPRRRSILNGARACALKTTSIKHATNEEIFFMRLIVVFTIQIPIP
jgi:hypothetical protein